MKISRQSLVGGIGVLALVSLGSFLPTPVSANTCGGPYPPKPAKVWAKSGPGGGQVTITWEKSPYADRYAIAYGTQSGNYQYGADNIGGENSTSYTVSSLESGTRYYFRLAAAHGCASSPFSDEVATLSGSGAVNSEMHTATPMTNASYMNNSNISAVSGPGVGQVTLKWWGIEADNYHIMYGANSGNYEYGALNVGKTNQLTVKSLSSGKTYFFAVVPVGGSKSQMTIGPVSARAMAPVVVTMEPTALAPEPVSMAEPMSADLAGDTEDPEALDVYAEDEDYDYTDEDDDTDNEMYENENTNVLGAEIISEYDQEYAQYAAENQAVDPEFGGEVAGIEADSDHEPEDDNYAIENETTGNTFGIGGTGE